MIEPAPLLKRSVIVVLADVASEDTDAFTYGRPDGRIVLVVPVALVRVALARLPKMSEIGPDVMAAPVLVNVTTCSYIPLALLYRNGPRVIVICADTSKAF